MSPHSAPCWAVPWREWGIEQTGKCYPPYGQLEEVLRLMGCSSPGVPHIRNIQFLGFGVPYIIGLTVFAHYLGTLAFHNIISHPTWQWGVQGVGQIMNSPHCWAVQYFLWLLEENGLFVKKRFTASHAFYCKITCYCIKHNYWFIIQRIFNWLAVNTTTTTIRLHQRQYYQFDGLERRNSSALSVELHLTAFTIQIKVMMDGKWIHEFSLIATNLTHWGRDRMAAIFQTTVSNGFSWMKMYEFRLKLHWSLFPRVQLTIFQHWFR